jgi:hypothetical protein
MSDGDSEPQPATTEPPRVIPGPLAQLRRGFEVLSSKLFKPLWVTLKARFSRFPVVKGIVQRAYLKKRTADWSREDPKNNQETTPPTGERVTVHGLWAMEFYTPSHAEQLLAGFRKLRWDQQGLGRPDLVSWVQQGREAQEGGWHNLGIIERTGKGIRSRITRSAPLPDSVEHVTGAVLTLTSSLTCVVLLFVFDDAHSSLLQHELTAYRKTYLEPLPGGGFSVIEPEHQKLKSVLEVRTKLRRDAWEWFRANLPGVFSSQPTVPNEFPTCELATMLLSEPGVKARGADGSSPEFLRILGLDHAFDAWKIEGLPTLRFMPLPRADFFHSTISVRESDLLEAAKAHHWGGGKSGMVSYADSTFQRFLTRWGLVGLLALFQRRISSLRDSERFRFETQKESLSTIKKLSDIEFQGLDVSAVSDELEAFAKGSWFAHGVVDFSPVNPEFYKSTYVKGLQKRIEQRARTIQHADRRLRQFLSQQGVLLASYENISLQRKMKALTILTVVLSILAIVVAVVIPTLGVILADPAANKSLLQWFSSFHLL